MSNKRSNRSGSLRFTPATIAVPESETELAQIVRKAAAEHQTVRVRGAGEFLASAGKMRKPKGFTPIWGPDVFQM